MNDVFEDYHGLDKDGTPCDCPSCAPETEPSRPRSFTNARTSVAQTCRLDPQALDMFYDDPMTSAYGVDTGEFVNDWRRKDIADGCPFCRQEVEDNLSEPDVMSRWGIR